MGKGIDKNLKMTFLLWLVYINCNILCLELIFKMNVLDHYEVVEYKSGECDKYDPERIYWDDVAVWYKNQLKHRDDDLPAVRYLYDEDYKGEWYQDGKLHRNGDLPAVVNIRGRFWFQHGKLHRDNDLPAIILTDQTKYWFQHGECHRDNDQPAIVSSDEEHWVLNGKRHRDNDKPAIIKKFGNVIYQAWYRFDKLHRDGKQPAVIDTHRKVKMEWWEDGKKLRRPKQQQNIAKLPKLKLKLNIKPKQ